MLIGQHRRDPHPVLVDALHRQVGDTGPPVFGLQLGDADVDPPVIQVVDVAELLGVAGLGGHPLVGDPQDLVDRARHLDDAEHEAEQQQHQQDRYHQADDLAGGHDGHLTSPKDSAGKLPGG